MSQSSAPTPAGRQRRENRDRVDIALVEHAEHDVDDEDRGGDQERRRADSDSWNACAVPWNVPCKVAGAFDLVAHRD